jgi:GlcNAc-P-P-Und epimerase
MRYLITGGSGFIGTHLIDRLLGTGAEILNLDICAPQKVEHAACWKSLDILDQSAVHAAFESFSPDCVIHLAARTDTDSDELDEYRVNTEGTANIVAAIKASATVSRVVITSTQFVNQYSGVPKSDTDYAPHTTYGESKVIAENITRDAHLDCTWTIVRPTNIWGAWHPRYPKEFWKVLGKGLYVHPGSEPVIRAYGYVGNVVDQLIRLTQADATLVDAKVFYLGDPPINLKDWVNGFSMCQTGKPVKVVPRAVLWVLAKCGDFLAAMGIRAPLTSSRYKSMTVGNSIPMDKTLEVCGHPPYSLEAGIEETVAWLRKVHPALVSVPPQKRDRNG